MVKFLVFLKMMRPANVITAIADVLAGMAIVGFFAISYEVGNLLLICLSTACLYAGGIIFNDVFDIEIDRLERPERALPGGQISVKQASVLGALLLLTGIAAAFAVALISGFIAFMIAAFALLYDKLSKHHPFFGPLNMGLCRGLNLLLGMSVLPTAMLGHDWVALVPLCYIFAITMISQGEVHGGGRRKLFLAALLYFSVIAAISYVAYIRDEIWISLVFLSFFSLFIFRPLMVAFKNPIGPNIGQAVKWGVISLILMDAAWAAAFGEMLVALLIACLLPISLWLAKRFAVT